MDWNLVVNIVVPIVALFLGAWITRWFESKPQLITHYGQVGAFKFTRDDGEKADIFTHTVVARNTGRKAASNVRIRHSYLPHFHVFPDIEYSVVQLPGGGSDIVVPTMIPGQEITVAYLYFPPTTYADVNNGVLSDEGYAKPIQMLLQKQLPRWVGVTVTLLAWIGIVALIYMLVPLVRRAL